jgi:hypothetical protein
MMAADGNDFAGEQVSVDEQRERGGPRTKIQHEDARPALVRRGDGKPTGIGRRHQPGDRQIGALRHVHEVAQRRVIGGDGVQIDAQGVGGKPARIGNALGAVEAIGDSIHVQQSPAIALDVTASGRQQAGEVNLTDGAALNLGVGGKGG